MKTAEEWSDEFEEWLSDREVKAIQSEAYRAGQENMKERAAEVAENHTDHTHEGRIKDMRKDRKGLDFDPAKNLNKIVEFVEHNLAIGADIRALEIKEPE
jgi:hypothetical protein